MAASICSILPFLPPRLFPRDRRHSIPTHLAPRVASFRTTFFRGFLARPPLSFALCPHRPSAFYDARATPTRAAVNLAAHRTSPSSSVSSSPPPRLQASARPSTLVTFKKGRFHILGTPRKLVQYPLQSSLTSSSFGLDPSSSAQSVHPT